jgi:surfeit locus 1 family protein
MTATTAAAAQKPLGKAGVVFFGSLCLGTFGLGVWQSKRYGEKVEQLALRDAAMALPPSDNLYENDSDDNAVVVVGGGRRIRLRGTFDHAKEFYVGPRGSPLRQSTGSLGVPQHGYFVVTPLLLSTTNTTTSSSSRTEGPSSVLVNRGWVPRAKVDGSKNRPRRQGVDRDGTPFAPHQAPVVGDWDRPAGVVTITAVKASVEGTSSLLPSLLPVVMYMKRAKS